MNILPMVFVFIAILTSLSYTFVNQTKFLSQEQKLCVGFLKAERSLINARHKKIFYSFKVQEKNHQKALTQNRPVRSKKGGYFNLYYLIDSSTEKMALSCLCDLFTNAYGSYANFEKLQNPSFVKDFLKALKDQGQKKLKETEELSLIDLFPENSIYTSIYYKMLKGTLKYRSAFTSYPSLEKNFIIKKSSSGKFFSFAELSYEQLSWVFGKAIAAAIEKKETEINQNVEESRKRVLFKHECEEILLQHRYKDSLALLGSVSFQPIKTLNSSLKGLDPSTNITLVWEDK
jgi:hypothetical protein